MSLKSIIKKIIMQTKKREIVPIQHNVDNGNMLQDKVAVIIGGSGGIGLSIAKSFYESGCKIVLCGTNEKKLKKCIDEFPETNRIRYMVFDVSDFEKIEANVKKTVEFFGRVDILVNSAGVHTEKADFLNMTLSEYDRVMNINIKGPYFLSIAFGKYMISKNIKGHILLVSSSRGSEPAWSPYGISKWSLNGLTKGLAQMLLPYGIVVNGVAPGSTATELLGVKEGDSIYTTENRVQRLIMPDEVANVAKMLVSSAGNMIVGETIHISGGRGICDIR